MDQEEISSLIPPTVEELDNMMGATQSQETQSQETQSQDTQPPTHVNLFEEHKKAAKEDTYEMLKVRGLPASIERDKLVVPYPFDVFSIEELAQAPIPDWSEVSHKHYHAHPEYIPHLLPAMADHLEPNTYWAIGGENNGAAYSINPKFVKPKDLERCKVHEPRGYIEFVVYHKPDVKLLIVFDADIMAPHEAIITASQLYEPELMSKDQWPFETCEEDIQVYLYAEHFCIPDFKPYNIRVKFNSPTLAKEVKDFISEPIKRVKNTLWEFVFIHVWSHFIMNVPQEKGDTEDMNKQLMAQKYCFLDKFEDVKFESG